VDVLNKLVREALARFVLTDVDLANLSPANRKQYEEFVSDPENIGYLVA